METISFFLGIMIVLNLFLLYAVFKLVLRITTEIDDISILRWITAIAVIAKISPEGLVAEIINQVKRKPDEGYLYKALKVLEEHAIADGDKSWTPRSI